MKDFRDLQVWHKTHALTLAIYQITGSFAPEEKYGLVSQMRRSSASIPTNMAEGCGRDSDAELARFLQISMGSASELEYQLLLAQDLGYLTPEQYTQLNALVTEVKRMMAPLIRSLSPRKPTR
jgi:four helix bundle protein